MHKRVSSGERHTSSGDNNARNNNNRKKKKIIAPIIIDRSMANASSRPTSCRPVSKKLRSVPT